MYEVYGTITLDISTLVEANSNNEAVEYADRILDRLGLKRDKITLDLLGEKVGIEIHSASIKMEDAIREGEAF